MKIVRPLTLIFTCVATLVIAQEAPQASKKKISLNGVFSVGRSTFTSNISAPSQFPTLETRIGIGAVKSLGEIFELRTRLTVGVKFKRKAFNRDGIAVIGPPFMELDELASSRDHYFYEIPLVFQANLKHPQIGIRAGANYRRFFPNNSNVDALTARSDLGLLAGVTYGFNQKLSVGIEYCHGLTKIISSGGSVNTFDYNLDVKNEFSQITFEFAF